VEVVKRIEEVPLGSRRYVGRRESFHLRPSGASGKTSDAPEALAVAQNIGSEPKSDNEPSQQCYPLEGRQAEIELYYAHAAGLDARPTSACFVR